MQSCLLRSALNASVIPCLMLGHVLSAAAEGTPKGVPSAEACLKTVSAMGATMGEAMTRTGDAGSTSRFLVRTNGIDYDVVCDGATGLVKDVTRHVEVPETGSN